MKKCIGCSSFLDESVAVCSNCGSNQFVAPTQEELDYIAQYYAQQNTAQNQQYTPVNNQINNYPQPNATQVQTQQVKQSKAKNAVVSVLPKILSVVAVIIVIFLIGIYDNNETKQLEGVWTYDEVDTITIDGIDYEVKIAINLKLTEGTFKFYVDEEKTTMYLKAFYDEWLVKNEVTQEMLASIGYDSVEKFKDEVSADDMTAILDEFYKECRSGRWEIKKTEFIFKHDDESTEYKTEDSVDGDVLELKTDGITLTRVESLEE